jgi:hypothetical protein
VAVVTTSAAAPGPIAATAVWQAVMETAGYRCQCRGGCRRSHANSGGRCPAEHKSWCHLIAAPATPTGNPHRDLAAALVAYCPKCFDEHKAPDSGGQATDPDGGSLFDL